jgi:hypothetical protein
MRVSNTILKGATVLNKVNHKKYEVVENDGGRIIAIRDEKQPNVEYNVSTDGRAERIVNPAGLEQVMITEKNAICFRVLSYGEDTEDYSKVTEIRDRSLVINGISVQMGSIKVKKILGFLPGKVILERDDVSQICSYEPLRDKFATLCDAEGVLFVLGAFSDTLILGYKKEEEQEKEDGTKENVLKAAGVYVIDDKGNAEKLRSEKPFEAIVRVKGTEDKEFFLKKEGTKEYEILSNRRCEYSLSPSLFEGVILEATATYQDELAVIGEDHICVGGYNISYAGQTLIEKGTTRLVDLTSGKDKLSFSFSNEEATEVTTINVTVTKDRGYIVEEPKSLPGDAID